ncbi:MAG: sugar ABC transporter substrate-binding protein [Chloroflexota bacterium]
MSSKIVFFLFLSLSLLGTACNSTESPADRPVRFMVFGDAAERAAYQQLVDAFHQTHPDLQVELTHIPSQSDYRTRLVTEFAAGSPPDVSLINYRRYASFAAQGLLEPIGPHLEQSQVIQPADFYPVALEAFTWEGTLTCLPQNISSLVVYYNRDLFQAAGLPEPPAKWTWAEFLAAAKALTRDVDGDGRIDQYGLGIEPSLIRLAPFVWQNGGVIVDNPDTPHRLTLTRFPSQEAFQWFVDLRQVHQVVPDRVEEAAQDSENRFVAGTTAMFLNSRRGTPTYREITTFTWDVAPLPNGKTSAGILHSDAYCLAASSANKTAAWTFIEFANSVEGQTIIASSGRTVPSLIAVAESEAFLNPGQAPGRSRVFLDGIPVLQRVPVISTWDEIEQIANEEIERAFYGDITVEAAGRLMTQRTEEYFLLGQAAVTP